MELDLNCDLGEGEPLARTRALMRQVTSANVACGGHAGNLASMERCVRLARRFHVRLGAHPGVSQSKGFGRDALDITAEELELVLLQQVGALERIARGHGLALHHIKLHGSLYHASEADPTLAGRYVAAVRKWWPRAKIYAKAGGQVVRIARRMRVSLWEEAFLDRGYASRIDLIPRGKPSALLTDVKKIRQRVHSIISHRTIRSISGEALPVDCRTLCVHSDTPHSIEIARAVRTVLREEGQLRRPSRRR